MHDVNFVVAVAEGGEGDPLPVRRPACTQVVPAAGEALYIRAIGVDGENIAVALRPAVEGKLRAVRRPGAAATHIVQVRDLVDIRPVIVHHVQLP